MFTEQMIAAKFFWRNIPYPHTFIIYYIKQQALTIYFIARAYLILTGSPFIISENYRYNLTKYHSRLQEERFIGPAPWGASVSPVPRSAPLGRGFARRSLGRSLGAFAGPCPARLGWRLGAGSRQPHVLASSFLYDKEK